MNIHHFNELPTDQQLDIAELVSHETKSLHGAEQKIIPIDPEDVFLKDIGMVALRNNTLLGYIAASRSDLDGRFTKVGSLVVPSQFQGLGVGNELISAITKEVVQFGSTPFAFCNQNSQSCFAETGYTGALPEELPPDFRSPFGNQPMIYPRMKLSSLLEEDAFVA